MSGHGHTSKWRTTQKDLSASVTGHEGTAGVAMREDDEGTERAGMRRDLEGTGQVAIRDKKRS